MADTKTISFKFVVDPQSVSQVKRVLTELTAEAEKFAKAMKAAGGGLFGGGSVGSGVASKSMAQTTTSTSGTGNFVYTNVAGVQKTAEEGVKGLRKLSDETRRSTDSQKRDIMSLGRVLDEVIGKFRQFSTPMGAARGIAGMFGGGGGAAGAGSSFQTMSGMGAAGVVLGSTAAILGAAWGGAKAYAGWRNFQTQGLRTEGMAGASLFPQFQRTAMGDTSDALAMSQMSVQDRATMQGFAANTTGNAAMGIIEHPWEATKNAVWGLFNEDAAEKAWHNQQTAWQHQKVRDMVDTQKQTAQTQRLLFGQSVWDSNYDQRVSAQALFGVQSYGISRGIDPTLGDTSLAADQLYVPSTTKNLTFGDVESRAQRRGFSAVQVGQAGAAMRSMVGKAGFGFGQSVLEVQRAGYSGYDSILARSLEAGNRGDLYAMGGSLSGDRQLGINLASGIFRGYDPTGTTGGIGALAAAQGALAFERGRGLTDAALVQQQLAGNAAGENIFKGASSPLQGSRNYLSARNAAPGVNRMGVDALSKLGFTQAMDIINNKAPIPDQLQGNGVDRGMIQKYVEGKYGVLASVFDDIIDPRDGSKTSAALGRLNKARAGGMSVADYLRSKTGRQDARWLGAAASSSGIAPAGAMQAAIDQMAYAGKARMGHAPAAKFDKLTQAKMDMDAILTKVREGVIDEKTAQTMIAGMQVTPQNAATMAFSKNAGDAAAALIAAGVAVQVLAGTAAQAGAGAGAGGKGQAASAKAIPRTGKGPDQ